MIYMGKSRLGTFSSGSIWFTESIFNRIKSDRSFGIFVFNSLERYLNQDWCDGVEDRNVFIKNNAIALEKGLKLCGAYKKDDSNEVIWIITEGDRTATTVLFSSEY